MTTRRTLAWLAGVLLALPGLARAQAAPTAAPPIEVSPFVSSGVGDSAGVGAAVRFPLSRRFAIVAEAEFRHTDGRPLYNTADNDGFNGSLNLTFDLPSVGRVRPYLVGGGGIEHYAFPEYAGPFRFGEPPPFVVTETGSSFVVNAGGGVRVPVTERWGLRAEVRWSDGWTAGAPESLRIFYGATIGVGGAR